MNNDSGRLNFSTGIDNSQLRSDADESKRILQGITGTAIKEGNQIDEVFKKIGKNTWFIILYEEFFIRYRF